jgi:hypothetical protein
MTEQGQVVRTLTTKKEEDVGSGPGSQKDGGKASGKTADETPSVVFLGCTHSIKGRYAYCLGDNSRLYTFHVESGEMEETMEIFPVDEGHGNAIGVVHHPLRNMILSWSDAGYIRVHVA